MLPKKVGPSTAAIVATRAKPVIRLTRIHAARVRESATSPADSPEVRDLGMTLLRGSTKIAIDLITRGARDFVRHTGINEQLSYAVEYVAYLFTSCIGIPWWLPAKH